MTVLNRSYLETWYRCFSSIVMRWLIDGALVENPNLQSSLGVTVSASGINRDTIPSQFKVDQEFVRDAIRYWTESCIIMEYGISSWANDWMEFVSTLPPSAKVEWDTWNLMFSAFLDDAYLSYWNEELSGEISSQSLKDFWGALWSVYGRARGIDPEDTRGELSEVIHRFSSRDNSNLSVINQIPNVLEEMCNTVGLSWYGVPQPTWATTSLDDLRLMSLSGPEHVIDWDTPLIILSRVTGKDLSIEKIIKYLKRYRDDLTKLFLLHLDTLRNGTEEPAEFWFPLENHRLAAGSEVNMGLSSKVIGVSETLAALLTKAGGIGPRPPIKQGDAFIVVSSSSIGNKSAFDQALTEVGRIQNILRIADAGFRWNTSFYYFVAVQLKDLRDDHQLYVAERLDTKQLYSDLTSEWLCQVRDWISKVEQNNTDLGKALSVALKWQGLSRSQNGYEGKFLALWIALERLGGGNYEYKNVIPHIAGTLWRWNIWQGLNKADQIRCVYLYRKRMGSLINDLAKMRSQGVVHRGEFSNKVDVRFATMLLEEIVNDLLIYMLRIVATHEKIRTFSDLMDHVDKMVGLQ